MKKSILLAISFAYTLVVLSMAGTIRAQGPCGGKPCGGEKTAQPAPLKTPRNSGPTKPLAPAKPRPPATGSLIVNANLANATVTVNGRIGGTTDSNGYLLITPVTPGACTVVITKPNYHADKSVVTLSAGQSRTLSFELKPITQAISISSSPPDCEVFIDEVLMGRTDAAGNFRMANVPVGNRRVTLRKARYREADFAVSLTPEKEEQIAANLELAVGFLTIKANLPAARIEVSGLGRIDQGNKFECNPGTYSVTVSSPLYLTVTKEVRVAAGKEAELTVVLEPDVVATQRLVTNASEAFQRRQYARAAGFAKEVLTANSKHAQALSILAQCSFMTDDFGAFSKAAGLAIEAGGSIEVPVKHHHSFFGTPLHDTKLVLTRETVSFDPQLGEGMVCPNKAFTLSLQTLSRAELAGNLSNEIYLRLTFAEPNDPKKTVSLKFADRESAMQQGTKSSGGGLIGYSGYIMTSRRQALQAMTALVHVMNGARGRANAAAKAARAALAEPDVIMEVAARDHEGEVLPPLESIIDAGGKALGGKENIDKWTSAVLVGNFTATTATTTSSGSYEQFWKGRSKVRVVWSLEGAGVVQEDGYDGSVGWTKTYKKKPRLMSTYRLALTKQYLLLLSLTGIEEFKLMYPESTLKGRGRIGTQKVYVIEASPSTGRPQTLYFDVLTGLLVRWDYTDEDSDKKGALVPIKLILGDYVELGGRKIPTSWKQIAPTFTISMKLPNRQYAAPIDDAKFKMPAK